MEGGENHEIRSSSTDGIERNQCYSANSFPQQKAIANPTKDNSLRNDVVHAYADWED